jgi:hypothetical protein
LHKKDTVRTHSGFDRLNQREHALLFFFQPHFANQPEQAGIGNLHLMMGASIHAIMACPIRMPATSEALSFSYERFLNDFLRSHIAIDDIDLTGFALPHMQIAHKKSANISRFRQKYDRISHD